MKSNAIALLRGPRRIRCAEPAHGDEHGEDALQRLAVPSIAAVQSSPRLAHD
jgi:hypothetical protein